ncbi:prenyltransferase [Phototrophicus methaneseepsis]|uniref:Prenyltransferase n=1 Tax=Phototrophicus methaneseepsis TaxID=2710758 RepID=A0A7S8E5B0_9CHLR|nr:prenyltransferase [Phototrophicus methaneseepsis]QPC80632.1 prenyltransferase [Phototrophicus methaneseepsis]
MAATIDSTTTFQLSDKAKALLRLTRWREHVPYTIPAVAVGAMMAVHLNETALLDWRLVPVIIANILAMSFAFMINDVADAPDDALNPKKKAHNVISSGILSNKEGKLASGITFVASLALFALGGPMTLALGALTLILSYLYSAHPYRFKARPITDVVSHVLMLSGLLVMTGYFTYDNAPGPAWLVIAGATLFSAYGQFYNQIDDYDVDKEAGLKNTVVLLGKTGTKVLMYTSAVGALVCFAVAVFAGVFPTWLGTVALITIFAAALFVWETDMRGNAAVGSGAIQKPGLLVANMIVLMWIAAYLGMFSAA